MHELPQPIAVVCHDAGAANIILAAMQADATDSYLPVMQGPAEKLWQVAGRPGASLMPLDAALAQARSVLSGTGWASCLEHDALREARRMGLPTAAVMDHWVNYAARFERDGEVILPDEFWVTDSEAFKIASNTFEGARIRLMPNLYLQEQVRQIGPPSPHHAGNILYVLEPIRARWSGSDEPGEFEALDYFMTRLEHLGHPNDLRIRLRPHPSDAPGKYDAWLARQNGLNVALDRVGSLAQAIGQSEWVAGCETMALVVALASGRKVVCTLPPAAPPCRLPHSGLLHLRKL